MHKSSRFALPLITRPTEHSGVTFGAATSVLLTVLGECFWSEALQKWGGLNGIRMTEIAAKIKKPTSLVGYRVWGRFIYNGTTKRGLNRQIHYSKFALQPQNEEPTRRSALGGLQNYKKSLTLDPSLTGRGKKRESVGFGASLRTRPTELQEHYKKGTRIKGNVETPAEACR